MAVVSCAAVNTGVHVSFWITFFLDRCSAGRLLDHMVVLCLALRNLNTVLHNGVPSLHSHQWSRGGSVFSALPLAFIVCRGFLFPLFVAALGLTCCVQAFSSCGQWGCSFLGQGSNLYPLHWQADSKLLNHQGSPYRVFNEARSDWWGDTFW